MKYVDITEYKYLLWDDEIIKTSIFPEADIIFDAFALATDGTLTLKGRLFMWNGPSGPTIDTPDSMLGSAAHDALYRAMRLGALDLKWRRAADELLRDICMEQGMSKERAELWYGAVRMFAESCAAPDDTAEFQIVYI